MQHRYRLVIRWTHQKWGPQMEKLAANGSSIRRALNSALLGFFKDANSRDQRRGAHAELEVKITRTKEAIPEHTRRNQRL